MDSSSALMIISSKKEIKTTELQLSVKVGTQTISTTKFMMEVFDCKNHLKFASRADHQINDAED